MADGWTFKRATVEQYQFRGPFGLWAIITLDPRGVFQAVSDLGTYAYSGWGHHGCKSFKHFLVGLREADYFLEKTCTDGRGAQVFDFDATVREIRRWICERRREDLVTKREARDAWDELEELDDPGNDQTFWVERIAEKETLFKRILGNDYCEVPCCRRLADGPLRFFNEIFRGQLVPVLQAEIAETERSCAAGEERGC